VKLHHHLHDAGPDDASSVLGGARIVPRVFDRCLAAIENGAHLGLRQLWTTRIDVSCAGGRAGFYRSGCDCAFAPAW
jgi:hypothetical protein